MSRRVIGLREDVRTLFVSIVASVILSGWIGATASLADNKETVALVMKALTNPFFSKMEAGAKAYAQQKNIPLEVFGVERETDVDRQVSIVENLISRRYGAVVIAPADSTALVPVCKKALDVGIVVVNIDNPLHRETMMRAGVSIPFVGPDNRFAGRQVGEYTRGHLNSAGRVIVIEGIRGVENAEQRKAGFSESVTQGGTISIVASESANWHTDEALSLSMRLLEDHKPVDAVICANDKMALGVLQALDILGMAERVCLTGYDNIQAVRQEMQQGRIHATVEQHPELMGEFGVDLAVQALEGKDIALFIPTPVDLITHETFGQRVALLISSVDNPFFAALAEQARQTAGLHGLELVLADSTNDDAQQLTDLMAVLNQGIDAVIINPTNSETIGAGIEAANKRGIPVVTVDRKAADGDVVCHIESDNVSGGRMAAELLARHLGGAGRVVELEGIPGTSAAQERGKGFNEALRSYPDIQVVARRVGNFNRERAADILRELLEHGPSFDGVFAHNDNMILGAMDTLNASDPGRACVLVGFDGIQEALQAIEQHQLTATVVQRPAQMGALAIDCVVAWFRGRQPIRQIRVDLGLAEP